MSLKASKITLDKPIAEWPVFYKDGLPFIYDDEHLFFDEKGNRLGEHPRHSDLGVRVRLVLEWLYDGQNCTIKNELTFRASVSLAQTGVASDKAIRRGYVDTTPDVSVLKGVPAPDTATYHIGPDHPPPVVVFEIGSPSTYDEDLGNKFLLYEQVIRAKEYITYDPHQIRLWEGPRLKGWQLVNGHYQELRANEQGWLWSEELQSWLVEDGQILQFYDAQGNLRQTKAEYQTARADQATTRADQATARADQASARAEQERIKAEQASARAEQERIKAEQASTKAEQANAQAELERARAEMERARAEEANARAEEANARTEEANARAEEANARAEIEKAKVQEANARAELEKARADQLVVRLQALEAQLRKLNQAPEA